MALGFLLVTMESRGDGVGVQPLLSRRSLLECADLAPVLGSSRAVTTARRT